MATQLTEHFTLEELLASPTATADGISEQFTPDQKVIDNLDALAYHILEPIRVMVNQPVRISSGYRCSRLNEAVGGKPTSQHLVGQAADISADTYTPQQLFDTIKNSTLAYDQMILEHDGRENYWVHVSFNDYVVEQRQQAMEGELQAGGGTVITKVDPAT